MKTKKTSQGKMLVPDLKHQLKNYRYCVLFFKEGKKTQINLYPTVSQAEADINYIAFEKSWSDRPQTYNENTIGEVVAYAELREWPEVELTSEDAKKIQSAKTQHRLVMKIKYIYEEYGNVIGWKKSIYTLEWNEKRKAYVRALLCWSEKLGFYVGTPIRLDPDLPF